MLCVHLEVLSVCAGTVSPSWHVYNNTNDVNAFGKHHIPVKTFGKVPSADACQHLAEQNNVSIYTWHGPNHGKWTQMCVLRLDGKWDVVKESGIVSGWKGSAPPPAPAPPTPKPSPATRSGALPGMPLSFECAWRSFTLGFAKHIQVNRNHSTFTVKYSTCMLY